MPNSRKKGNTYELKIAKEFRDFGFVKCKTSRYESKMLDDMKVDLTNTGFFNIQCKAVEKLSSSYHDIIESMPKDNNYNVIFHKRNRKGEVVVMSKEDFYEIVEILIKSGILNVDKLAKHDKLWFKMLKNLGASDDDARDIVQDMYIKIHTLVDDVNKIMYGDDINKYYIYKTIRNMYIDLCKENKNKAEQFCEDYFLFEDEYYNSEKDIALNKISDNIRIFLNENSSTYDKKLVELYFGFHTNKNNKTIQPVVTQRQLAKNQT